MANVISLLQRNALPSREEYQHARLPILYEEVRAAISRCESLDLAKDFSDKTQALLVYARLANDDETIIKLQRLQAHALRRCGELLKDIPERRGRSAGPNGELGRHASAVAAGLSEHQRVQSFRIARVPRQEFEYLVESSSHPPTVGTLADMGRLHKSPPTQPARRFWQGLERLFKTFDPVAMAKIEPGRLDLAQRGKAWFWAFEQACAKEEKATE